MLILKKFVLSLLALSVAGGLAYASYDSLNGAISGAADEVESDVDGAAVDNETDELGWELDSGYRIAYASNPRLFGYENGVVKLGYEFHAKELQNAPGERGWIAVSYDDGVTFEDNQSFDDAGIDFKGPGIELPDGTYRRYTPDLSDKVCGITSQSSKDGENWIYDDGLRYDLSSEDCYMGVWTFFVDDEGGVVLLYNHDDHSLPGKETIYVRRAYSEPGDNGMNFELEDEDVLEGRYDDGSVISYADPNAVVLPDGRVRLIVMWQDPKNPYPPLGRQGTIYSFISEDGGRNFELEGKVVSWEDVTEFEVYSLNDPKILMLDDGSFRIWVAAMIVDEEEESGFNWVMLSAHLK